jgi:hypothetical protein
MATRSGNKIDLEEGDTQAERLLSGGRRFVVQQDDFS